MTRSPGVVFGGVTTQSEPVALELTKTPVPAIRLHLAWRASCPAAPLWDGHDGFHGHVFALDPHGGFAGSLEWPMGHHLTRLADVEGTVGAQMTSGWAFVQQILSGSQGGSCDTGRVRWTAFTG